MYIEKFRNLTYLEQQLEDYNKAERDRMEVGDTTELFTPICFCFIGNWDFFKTNAVEDAGRRSETVSWWRASRW